MRTTALATRSTRTTARHGLRHTGKAVKHSGVHRVEAVTNAIVHRVDLALNVRKVGGENIAINYTAGIAAKSIAAVAPAENQRKDDDSPPTVAAEKTASVIVALSGKEAVHKIVCHKKTPISLFTSGRAPPGCIREAAFCQDAVN
jgi:hypothetical protein